MTIDTSLSSEHPYASASTYQRRGFSLSSGDSLFSDRTTNAYGDSDRPTILSNTDASTSTGYSSSSSSSTAPPSRHTYTLRPSSHEVPLMAVHLHSWAGETSDDPAYTEGQFISGSVDLNLRTPDRIKAVIVSVCRKTLPGDVSEAKKLNMNLILPIGGWVLCHSGVRVENVYACLRDPLG